MDKVKIGDFNKSRDKSAVIDGLIVRYDNDVVLDEMLSGEFHSRIVVYPDDGDVYNPVSISKNVDSILIQGIGVNNGHMWEHRLTFGFKSSSELDQITGVGSIKPIRLKGYEYKECTITINKDIKMVFHVVLDIGNEHDIVTVFVSTVRTDKEDTHD